eukprot:CAMPEP_0117763842 /NCGR_PEP_ID=MMETSP0947-20121206/18969_1 /TAXON_ID=44440 /ORGANISM="Chattonella subsalsa, Strain CCMP2191" /LENGTH=131 /DNA_ID=CAMNT_0005585807 /DNA_START=286 /DNA_END=681 /DNA_ORIENTATION=+
MVGHSKAAFAASPTDGLDLISYDEFVQLLSDGEIQKAKFYGSNGDTVVLTLQNSKEVSIGDGMIKESSTNPQSPLKIVNKLRDARVPYSFDFDLKKYSKAKVFPNEATKMAEERGRILDAEAEAMLNKMNK